MLTEDQIFQIVEIIANNYSPQKIVLFGSYARGQATTDSDLDLLIIKDINLPRPKRAKEVRKLLTKFLIPKDILVYTPEEVKEWENVKMAFITSALSEGKVLYEKTN